MTGKQVPLRPLCITCRDVNNQPLEGIKLWVGSSDSDNRTQEILQGVTPPTGRFVSFFPPNVGSVVYIRARAKGYIPYSCEADISAGKGLTLDITMRKDLVYEYETAAGTGTSPPPPCFMPSAEATQLFMASCITTPKPNKPARKPRRLKKAKLARPAGGRRILG